MREENIQTWAEEVWSGEPPPVQPPFDDHGNAVYDEPAVYKEESSRDFQKREMYEELTEKRNTGSTKLGDFCRQIKLLCRAGPDKGLPHPPKLLPAVAGMDHYSSSTGEIRSAGFRRHSTHIDYGRQLSPLSLRPVDEPNSADFVDIDRLRFTVAKAQIRDNERSPQPSPKAKKIYHSRFKEIIDPSEPITPVCYLTGRPKADTDIFRSNAVRKQSNPLSDHSARSNRLQ